MKRAILFLLFFPFARAGLQAAEPVAPDHRDNWHQWRGPEGTGVAPRGDPPLAWNEGKNVRWKVDLAGEGHSSPIVWGDQVFVLSSERTDRAAKDRPARDARKKTEAPGNIYRFLVTAIDRASGKVRWQRTACEDVPHEGRHETNSYASCSPTTDGQRLYASFGSRGIYCYDLEGKLEWKRDLGDMHTRFGWGEGASPALHGDALLVNWDQEEASFITALDARTGEPRWKVDRDESSSWATPLVVEHGGRVQVVVNGTKRVRSYDIKDGSLIWECGGQTVNAIPSPVAAGGIVYCMSGYRGHAACAIPLDSTGDITESGRVKWKIAKGTPYVPSPILHGDRLYFTRVNNAFLSCVDAATGKVLIDGERLPGLNSLYASPVGAKDRIYFVDRDGTTIVIRKSDRLEVLATNKLDDGMEATPAIAGRQMFLRGRHHLYCVEETPAAESKAAGTGGGGS